MIDEKRLENAFKEIILALGDTTSRPGMEDTPKEKISGMRKQAILERSGYQVKHVSFREWQNSKEACLKNILE